MQDEIILSRQSLNSCKRERVGTFQPRSAAWITYLCSSPVSVINRSGVPSGPRTTALKILY